MGYTNLRLLGVGLAILSTVTTVEAMAGQPGPKAVQKSKQRSVHSFRSVVPYLAHALRNCRCHEADDVFERRACKKSCKAFQKKMFGWASKHPVIHTDLALDVADYDFRTKTFVLSHIDSLNPESRYGRVDQDGVLLGSNRCETVDGELTSMVETKLEVKAKMPEKRAKQSVLRGVRSVQAVALLKGRSTRINWCCGTFMRREFAMDKTPCSSRGFTYSITEIAIGLDPTVEPSDETADAEEADAEDIEPDAPGSWQKGFNTQVLPIEFTPKLIGFENVPGNLEE